MDAYSDTVDYVCNLHGGEIDLRLHRVAAALDLFDHPELSYPAFHVAGTNGKGSTAAMLHGILSARGYRVGLYTSPHLEEFTERIRVADREIARDEVVELAGQIKDEIAARDITLTFFEFVTVMALVYFRRRNIDVAVVEVGLGGRLDATNLVRSGVSVVTTIAKDHEAFLGHDLPSIAREKGGIIKSGVPVVCGAFTPEIETLLREMADRAGAPSYFLGRDFSLVAAENGGLDYQGLERRLSGVEVGLYGRHQLYNAALAMASLEVKRRDFPVTESAIREGLSQIVWPGRFEIRRRRPTVILDGAHNGEGAKALAEAVLQFSGGRKVKLLFGAMADKDVGAMLGELAATASEVVLTKAPTARAADPASLTKWVPPDVPIEIAPDAGAAIDSLVRRSHADDIILVAGSLYLLGQVRPLVGRVPDERREENIGPLHTN
jgi:dihydrofolate synthase/folylpolyglutamate synthase